MWPPDVNLLCPLIQESTRTNLFFHCASHSERGVLAGECLKGFFICTWLCNKPTDICLMLHSIKELSLTRVNSNFY